MAQAVNSSNVVTLQVRCAICGPVDHPHHCEPLSDASFFAALGGAFPEGLWPTGGFWAVGFGWVEGYGWPATHPKPKRAEEEQELWSAMVSWLLWEKYRIDDGFALALTCGPKVLSQAVGDMNRRIAKGLTVEKPGGYIVRSAKMIASSYKKRGLQTW